MFNEFKEFLVKTNAIALAVGVIIGAAAGKLVTAFVDDLIMPLISLAIPGGNWRDAILKLKDVPDPKDPTKMIPTGIKYGDLLGNMVDFIIISLVVFLIVKFIVRPAPDAPTKTCGECKETIPADALKCKFCTSTQG